MARDQVPAVSPSRDCRHVTELLRPAVSSSVKQVPGLCVQVGVLISKVKSLRMAPGTQLGPHLASWHLTAKWHSHSVGEKTEASRAHAARAYGGGASPISPPAVLGGWRRPLPNLSFLACEGVS